MGKAEISDIDIKHLELLRNNVREFLSENAEKYDAPNLLVLDIAPQNHKGAKEYFLKATVKTLDIDKKSRADYILDLCEDNSYIIPDNFIDIVVCTEVLEHTLNPFDAVNEIFRILKSGGVILVSTPFNFRIHGPLPDCWRFTEHGLRQLFTMFQNVSIRSLDTENRDLMPIHYTLIARK